MDTLTRYLVACSLFLLQPCAFSETTTLWTYGVSASEGWVDYNKSWNNDDDMCWAASASDMITWWQNNSDYASYAAENTPTGSTVWDAFRASFTNDCSMQGYAYEWFFTGEYDPQGEEDMSQYIETSSYTGGYYLSMLENGGYTLDSFVDWIDEDDAHDSSYSSFYYYYSASIVDYLQNGCGIALAITNLGGTESCAHEINHALTLWGCEYEEDEDGNIIVTALYITDSDDDETALQKVDCAESKDYLCFYATYLGSDYAEEVGYFAITDLTVLSLTPVAGVPEPSTSVLLFAVVLPLAMRRRRS